MPAIKAQRLDATETTGTGLLALLTIMMTMFARWDSIHQARAVLVPHLTLTQTISSQQAATHDFLQPLRLLASGACQLIGMRAQTSLTSTSSWRWLICPQTTRKFMPRRTCLWSKVAPIWIQSAVQLTETPMDAVQHLNRKNNSSASH